MLEKSLEKICAEAFLENLQAKDIFSKFAENTPAAAFANNNIFRSNRCSLQTLNFSK